MDSRVRHIYYCLLVLLLFANILFLPAQTFGHSTPKRKSGLSARLVNLEATSKETFRYSVSLYNGRSRPLTYELGATAPPGWNTSFKIQGMQVTSFQADSNRAQDVSIELTPAPGTKPGKYTIPVVAVSEQDTLTLDLEAVVKGAYALQLTTPSGLLSGQETEGNSKTIDLTLRNEGTLPLDNVNLTAQTPTKWDITFEPSKVDRLDPGSSVDVVAHLNVPDKTITGDYLTTITASNTNATSSASYRLTVTTSLLTGWLGVLVIAIAVAIVYFLIRKYGRR
jgi:uncharacterized membrane protein